MRNITNHIATWRELSRHTWNVLRQLRGGEMIWDEADLFAEASKRLLDLVLLDVPGAQSNERKIWVVKAERFNRIPVMTHRADSGTTQYWEHYWDDPFREVSGDEDVAFLFEGVFDWEPLESRDFAHCQARIARFENKPELVGRQVLFEFQYIEFLVENATD